MKSKCKITVLFVVYFTI